jgi:2-haloacid dehalogenase
MSNIELAKARTGGAATNKPFIIFDVNETLLDLGTMGSIFDRIFGDRFTIHRWFADAIMCSEALTLAGTYAPFTDIGAAVLERLGRLDGVRIYESDKSELLESFGSMPPHPEVPSALERLHSAGFRMGTLSNNQAAVLFQQLERSGIIHNFDCCFSVDRVRRYKPALEAYRYVEAELRAKPSDLMLIACHAWDTLGAGAAGWHTALIRRPGNDVVGVGPQPELIGTDLSDVVEQLMQRDAERNSSSAFSDSCGDKVDDD